MTADELRATLGQPHPPRDLGPLMTALWHAGRGDWDGAHAIAQDIDTAAGAWVHAYLHRREGDAANAAHWYRIAGKPICQGDLDQEWSDIVQALLP